MKDLIAKRIAHLKKEDPAVSVRSVALAADIHPTNLYRFLRGHSSLRMDKLKAVLDVLELEVRPR